VQWWKGISVTAFHLPVKLIMGAGFALYICTFSASMPLKQIKVLKNEKDHTRFGQSIPDKQEKSNQAITHDQL
jgi:hypothetical protein